MTPADKQILKSELSGIEAALGAADPLIETAKAAAASPQVAVATLCTAVGIQSQQMKKALKLLEKIIDKS